VFCICPGRTDPLRIKSYFNANAVPSPAPVCVDLKQSHPDHAEPPQMNSAMASYDTQTMWPVGRLIQ